MELKETIAEWIKGARLKAGLSGDELATKLSFELGTTRGNSKANISHWETQKHSPGLEQILAIVRVTKVGLPHDLLLAMGSRTSPQSTEAPATDSTGEAEPVIAKARQSPNPGMQFIGAQEYYLLDLFRCTDDTGREDLLSFAERLRRVVRPAISSVRH